MHLVSSARKELSVEFIVIITIVDLKDCGSCKNFKENSKGAIIFSFNVIRCYSKFSVLNVIFRAINLNFKEACVK